METKVYENYLPDDAKYIRQTVFINEQGFEHELDELDAVATHIVIYKGESPIGTCRILMTDDKEKYLLGRFAILKEYRKQGYGALMLREAEEVVKSKGGTLLSLHAQCHVTQFYEKCGYVSFGEIEYEQDCPHIWMKRGLF